MAPPIPVIFSAGDTGIWRIDRIDAIAGEALAIAARLAAIEGVRDPRNVERAIWSLAGVTGQSRYVHRTERTVLNARSQGLGRAEATRAALIPIRKTTAWWDLEQDERRAIFEEKSHHIAASLEYLPAIARRLYHARELGEPFDFLTWFEFAPEHERDFDALLRKLRATEEWSFVDREVDIRLSR